MMILVSIFVALLALSAGGIAWWWVRREAPSQEQPKSSSLTLALEQTREEFEELKRRIYQCDAAAQRALGVDLNRALAWFRATYTNATLFARLKPDEQQAVLDNLARAEAEFHHRNQPVQAFATTLLRCWLTAVAAQDATAAREFEAHLDFFSRRPLEEEQPGQQG